MLPKKAVRAIAESIRLNPAKSGSIRVISSYQIPGYPGIPAAKSDSYPHQGKDDLDVYLGAAPRPVAELVPVDRVQLRHPLGNRPGTLPTGSEALERYRRFAKLGIDPDSAHEGDAIPHHLQDGLKRAVIGADGNEMPLGIPGVYRNPDDGFFYLAHSDTEESQSVKELRRRLATEKMERTGSADPIAANDNDPDIDEAVAQFYAQESERQRSTLPIALHKIVSNNYSAYISAITKLRKGQKLSEEEAVLFNKVKGVITEVKRTTNPQNSTNESVEKPVAISIPKTHANPDVLDWLLDLFRGDEGGSCPKPNCDEVHKHCSDLCIGMFEKNPNSLPGMGSDMKGRLRRCIRECMEAYGCFNY